MFRSVHPIGNRSGPVSSEAVKRGLNRETVAYADDRYVRCRQCGFINHLDRATRARRGSFAGDGVSQANTELASAVSIGDTTITVDSITGFDSSGTAYIYDTDTSLASGSANMMPFDYTGITSTTFTGCTSVTRAFSTDDPVRGEVNAAAGCAQCGSLRWV